ncbi:ABC transporter permease [Pelomonas sp. KK5]|uniref:ABC transporter permease n=1 Tax=Pelomonas sp. KK5 TaxID=1855730 RepID=UPI00097C52B3|nr:ABC transporter permease [Pelomonas sp. KK5]
MSAQRVVERLLASLGVIFGAVTLVFLVLNWLPGDPAELVAGQEANAETIERVRQQLGSDRPLLQQYLHYLGGLARGDLGTSYVSREPVAKRLAEQFPSTALLTLSACALAIVAGVTLGVVSARRAGSWVDQSIQTAALWLHSMPGFWLGVLLMLLFSVALGWLPVIGNSPLAMVLPVTALGLVVSVPIMRMVRGGMLDGLHEPFVTTLRAKGLGEARIFYVHVLRNALIPTVTLLGVVLGELLSGAVVIETLFARQGLGRITVEAITQKDIPVVQGAILVASLSFVVINLLVDLSYTWIDPRVRS